MSIANYNLDKISLMRGSSLKLTNNVSFKHPTLGEIEEIGYSKYSNYVSLLSSDVIDVADILWCESGIWYEDIKSNYDFFVQSHLSDKSICVKFIDSQNRVVKIADKCVVLDGYCKEALNYFLGLDGEYVVLIQGKENKEQTVLYNVKQDETGNYCLTENSFKLTEFFYDICSQILKDVNYIKVGDLDGTKGGTKRAKKYILKNIYKQRKKKHKANVTLESIISSLIAKGTSFEEIWKLPIYMVYNLYYRQVKIVDYNDTVLAYYNGCIDTKNHPVNWNKINWSSVID